jgi:TonB-linked SusC/RagA family outer membrane protein
MNKQYIKIIVALISLNILFLTSSFAQKPVVVKDVSGKPVPGVSVTIGEGAKPVLTNEKGEFTLKLDSKTPILIEADGFDSQLIIAYPAVNPEDVVLNKSPFQMSNKDKVDVPFGSFKKRLIPGAVTTLNPADILKYDQSKSFNGVINGRIPGFFGSSDNRGLGSPLVVVDGVPRAGTDYNLQQIEQITVLKDLFSTIMYGGQARNGIIYITTKRGESLKKNLNFTFESGVNKPISYPKYLSSGDYMTLYNEALSNDGLPAKYSQTTIDGTFSGANPVRYPDESYYNSTYLKNTSSYNSFIGEASGGNDIAHYYLNLGWNRSNSLVKLGEGSSERKDRINVRGNVDYKLNDFIKIRFDGAVVFNISNTPRYTTAGTNFWTLSSTLHPDNAPVLIPSELMKDKTLLGAAKLVDGKYLLGGTSEYQTNIYGELTRNDITQINERSVEMNIGLDFDLKFLAKGLTANLFYTYDLQNIFQTDILNSYAVYKPNYLADTINSWSKSNIDVKVNTQTLSDVTFSRRNGLYGKLDYKRVFGDHEITLNGLGYYDQYTLESVLQPTKHLNFGLRANYNYKKKIIAEFTGVASGSVKFYNNKPWTFSPGLGLAWIVTEESFLKDNSLLNYLKIRANWAQVKSDEGLPAYYTSNDVYSASTSYIYNHGLGSNLSQLIMVGNPNLGYEKRMNFNIGFDGFLIHNKLGIEGSYFFNKTSDVITKRVNYLPTYFGSYSYENYGSYQSQGVEFGLNYTENVGDFVVRVGSNLTYSVPKMLVMDELNYPDAYRKGQGKASDAMFGFVALGLFQNQAEIDNSVQQTFGTVKPGDIKYQDLNSDGVIDDLDQKMIGNSHSRIEYSFNISIKYKSFEFFALGTGQTGSETYFNNPYYWVYGDRKYSDVVLNRWTPSTAQTATYPRLTSLNGSNNFRNSTYWLSKNDWFTLQTAQLTYSLPNKIAGIKNASFFIRGNNLLTISKIKDKSQLNIGTAPQTRFYSLGISVML